MDFKHCTLHVDGAVATLTLNHPEVLNAVSLDMLGGLHEAMTAVEARGGGVRCLIMTGAGRAFCSGANLRGRHDPDATPDPRAMSSVSMLENGYHPLLRRFRNLDCPLIMAVNGVAAGAGMGLALMGDLILASRSAYFVQAFSRIGLVPDCGTTWTLPRLVGRPRAVELSLLGERLEAEKALEWGLVNRVIDDGEFQDEVRTLAQRLAAGPTVAMANTRKLYWTSADNTFEQQLDREVQSQLTTRTTRDHVEGVAAFLEKRPAQFIGR